ncbi:MAG TPA: cupin domain-containing protein [Caulobacteraceae bacterium]|nr:cupin domain-containing protein [Caulobacteraceae bacterium]
MTKIKVLSVSFLLLAAPAFAQTGAPQRLAPVDPPAPKVMASVDLGAEFPAMQGYEFAQMLMTVPPGAGWAWHSHTGSPEIVRILSGVLTDARNGGAPTPYGPGSTLVNAQGTQHMWANLGSEPVVFVATAIRLKK